MEHLPNLVLVVPWEVVLVTNKSLPLKKNEPSFFSSNSFCSSTEGLGGSLGGALSSAAMDGLGGGVGIGFFAAESSWSATVSS